MISRLYVVFVLFAGVALAYGANLLIAPDSMQMGVGEVATPNHDPHHVSVAQTAATPNHDPHPVGLMQIAATPNHDPHQVSLIQTAVPAESAAWEPLILRAEPEVAEPSAPVFVAADRMLSARANARLRAAPSTAAGVVAKLAANAPLRAIARSTDGVWWQVSLAGPADQQGRTAYVHRDAVTKYRAVKTKPPAAPASAPVLVPVPVAYPPPEPAPVPAPRSQHPLSFVSETVSRTVNQTMGWLVDVVGRPKGSVPKIIRAERAD